MFLHKNHAAGGENDSIMVGMFVFLCLASKKPSEQEFFVPARTDLGVKLLKYLKNHRRIIFWQWRSAVIASGSHGNGNSNDNDQVSSCKDNQHVVMVKKNTNGKLVQEWFPALW